MQSPKCKVERQKVAEILFPHDFKLFVNIQLTCIIHEDLEKASKAFLKSASNDLTQKQSNFFWYTRHQCFANW